MWYLKSLCGLTGIAVMSTANLRNKSFAFESKEFKAASLDCHDH